MTSSFLQTETMDHFDDDPDFGIGTEQDTVTARQPWSVIGGEWASPLVSNPVVARIVAQQLQGTPA